jgi:formate hydrogenlyase subunit 3/multisubunit Na+/H+ antiporter MnhD subunit
VSLAVFLVVTFVGTTLALLLRRWERIGLAIGVVGLAAAFVAALAMDPTAQLLAGGSVLAASPYLRLFLILGTFTGFVLSVMGLASGSRRDGPAVTLGTMGAAGLALALPDPRVAVLAITAGGMLGVLLTIVPTGGRVGAGIGLRDLRAVVVAGAMAISATAWIGRDLEDLVAQPVVFGLAYLAFALAVAIRFGAIPFHILVGRLTDAVPETGLPILIAWGPASLAIVGLAWVDASIAPLSVDVGAVRAIVVAIAVASIVLATFAAWIQDDLEHVVGYSIVGDAGVVMLAFAALDPAAWTPGRIWILAFVMTRSAFAAWAAVVRDSFWTGSLSDLRGWAIRSPLLAVGLMTITLAAVGLPGFAAFESRSDLVDLALDGPLRVIVFIATLAPIAYYGRLLVIGTRRLEVSSAPPVDWRPHWTRPDLTDVRGSAARLVRANRPIGMTLASLLLAVVALLTSIGAFGGPQAAAGAPPAQTTPGETAP